MDQTDHIMESLRTIKSVLLHDQCTRPCQLAVYGSTLGLSLPVQPLLETHPPMSRRHYARRFRWYGWDWKGGGEGEGRGGEGRGE